MPSDPLPAAALDARRRVGRRVRSIREERGWSQERLGEQAGIDRKSVYRMELATHSPSLDHLAMVASALEVPLSSLFT